MPNTIRCFFMVEAKLRRANMAEKNVDKYFNKGRGFESYNRFSITSADQRYYSNPILQTQFLHSFRPVDLTAGLAAVLSLQPSIKFPKEEI